MPGLTPRRIVAIALVLSTTLIAIPLPAADVSAQKPLGSVSAVGAAYLRGLSILQEGTVFGGDGLSIGDGAYAKVLLLNGNKIELAEKTNLSVTRDSRGVVIVMDTGTLGFTATEPLRISVRPFEVLAGDGAAGNVATMGSTTAGVRAINGTVTVRNLLTSESFVLHKGQERLLSLHGGAAHVSLADVASNVPVPIPAPEQRIAVGKTGGGWVSDTGAWLVAAAGAALSGVANWSNREDVEAQKKQNVAALTTSATALSESAAQVQGTGFQIMTLSAQTSEAIGSATTLAAQRLPLLQQTLQITKQANAAAATATSLMTPIRALQAEIAAAGQATAAQQQTLARLQTQLDQARNQVNTAIQQLTKLIDTANRQGAKVRTVNIQQVPAMQPASASKPPLIAKF